MLNRFILQLAPDLGIDPPPAPADDGSYLLSFEPNLQISLRENTNSGITLLTKIASVEQKSERELFQRLMEANLLGKETGKGVLGLDKEGKEITFTLFLQNDLSYKDFHDHLEDFTNYAEVWGGEVRALIEEKGNE